MKISFFCKHCGTHLRSGNHDECKKILRMKQRDETRRIREGEKQRKRFSSGDLGNYLADFENLG